MTNPIKIIGVPMSQNVRKPLAVAAQIGLAIENVPAMPGEETVTAINPSGRVPAMDDNGFKLSESNAIMIYLCGKAPNDLLPADERQRAQVSQWLAWDLAHWTPAYQPIQFERLVKQLLGRGAADEAVVAKAIATFHREAKLLDAALAGRNWIVGGGPTLADFAVGAGLTYAVPIRLPLDDYANIRAWNARVMGLEGFKKTVPQLPK